MNPLVFVASVAALGVGAGVAGALFGLGGGLFLVPALTLLFHVNIKFAIGASIVSVIATSSGAAAAYIRDRLTNVRIGVVLEIATTTGAISGAFLTGLLAPRWLFLIFGVLLLYSILPMVLRRGVENSSSPARPIRWPRAWVWLGRTTTPRRGGRSRTLPGGSPPGPA